MMWKESEGLPGAFENMLQVRALLCRLAPACAPSPAQAGEGRMQPVTRILEVLNGVDFLTGSLFVNYRSNIPFSTPLKCR